MQNFAQNFGAQFNQQFAQMKSLISQACKIVIISHKNPDGDAIGANLALRLALRHQLGKEVISAAVDPPPNNCNFLAEVKDFALDFDLAWADLIIVVDCGASYMMKFNETKPQILSLSPPLINIDHHATNDIFGTVNIVDPNAAATCQIIYHFLNFCGLSINRHIATCLLNGLYYDTGSFMHSNTKPETLEVASRLVWKGADFKTISRRQFHNMNIAQLKVYGKILQRAHMNSKKLIVSALSKKDFEEVGATPDDTTGAIDYLNSISDADFCCLLYENEAGAMKGSFRSRADRIDLSRLAGLFGGGGHKKAAGFALKGSLIETKPRVRISA